MEVPGGFQQILAYSLALLGLIFHRIHNGITKKSDGISKFYKKKKKQKKKKKGKESNTWWRFCFEKTFPLILKLSEEKC